MDEPRFVSAAELEAMTPDQREALINERVVTDLSTLDPKLVGKVRAEGRRLIEEHQAAAVADQQ